MALTLVLSVGLDPELLNTRNLVLQSAGYSVVRAFSLKAAVDCFRTFDFDLVLLCQSIPTKEKDSLTSWIRASGSRIPVVSVSGQFCQDDASTGLTISSDPGSLLWGIREVLIDAGRPAKWTAMSPDREEVAAAPRKESPESSDGYKGRAKATEEHFVSRARGLSNPRLILFPTK